MAEEDSGSNGSLPSDLPPYLFIADVLRGEIRDGRYPVGQRIPSQAELEERFKVSRPTVQRALGVLREDGYLDNQRGRSAEVLPWSEQPETHPVRASTELWQSTTATLQASIDAAFQERHVAIDAYSLTTETLSLALNTSLVRVQSGGLSPESITLRLLLPSLDVRLAIPRLVEDSADERPLWRLRQLVRAYVLTLRSAFTAVAEMRPEIEQSVEVRTVPITPMQKLYLFNGHTALSGYYQVAEHDVQFGERGEGAIYDILGLSAVLFPHHRDPAAPDSFDSRFVAESYRWFESLWDTIAEPLNAFDE